MAEKEDGNVDRDTSEILNGHYDGEDTKDAERAQNKLNTSGGGNKVLQNDFTTKPLNWKTIMKKMIPAPTQEMEDCYNKMARDAISSAVSAKEVGSGRLKPGECPDDPNKKGLCIIIDNSGSVANVLANFNKQILKLLLDKNNKKMLDNFYVIKFSSKFNIYKVDVQKETFREVTNVRDIFKKDGKKLNENPKLKGPELKVKTKLFEKTEAYGTDYTPEMHFVVNALHKANFNLIMFTDDDLSWGEENIAQYKKFMALGKKRKWSVAVFYTDQRSYDDMKKVFISPRWVTALET